MSSDKTEKPTPKKLKEARAQGQVAKSPDVGSWLAMLAATVIIPHTASSVSQVVMSLLMGANAMILDPDPERAVGLLGKGLREGAMALVPLTAVMVVVAIASSAAQGGLHPATKRLKPSFKSLNLIKGVKRLVGLMTWWEAVKILVKTAALGLVLWGIVRSLAPQLLAAVNAPLTMTLGMTASGVLTLVRASIVVGLVMAIADYLVKRKHIGKQLKMSRHEVQREHKQAEGDPHQKGARRSRQIAMSRNRMMSDLASADVVLVNPTHVAVALRYEPGKGAPTVIAKGAGAIAAAIRAKATEERIPLVEDIPLARAIHASCEIGQEIPANLYGAVAQVLAFVMSLRARGAAAGTHRSPTAGRALV